MKRPRHADFIAELPARLKWLREKSGLSQEKLAAAIGVSRPFIALLESGSRSPSIEVLGKILDACVTDAGVKAVNKCWYGTMNGHADENPKERSAHDIGQIAGTGQ
jgi:transcriptional regulator with XRE-family HTH domain